LDDQVSRARDDFSTKSLLYLFSQVENDAPGMVVVGFLLLAFSFLFVASRCNLMVGVGVRTRDRAGSFHPDPREMRSRAAGRSPFETKRDTRHLKQITTSV
jgi:hypothetical protein